MGHETTPSPDDLLLLPEVAEITRRSIDTLRWLRHCGKGPRGHRSGRRAAASELPRAGSSGRGSSQRDRLQR